MIVLAKQVPDTKQVTGKAMLDDGTVNRAALPAIFNPEDLNALELALQIKEQHGGHVTLVTMGPPAASEILREGLYRGVDRVVLLTDRRCAASDTLATSYILSCAVRTVGEYDMVICGRQAIDGDTAQVPPQTAEKLGLTQLTYLQDLVALEDGRIRVKRLIANGYEVVETHLPVLLTVVGTANVPRPAAVKRVMRYKHARSKSELAREVKAAAPDLAPDVLAARTAERANDLDRQGLLIAEWTLDDIHAELDHCGRSGSPTQVKRIQSIVLTASGFKRIEPTDDGIAGLVHELIEDHTIG
jgi:electron transfer flavoprotein beta subunit